MAATITTSDHKGHQQQSVVEWTTRLTRWQFITRPGHNININNSNSNVSTHCCIRIPVVGAPMAGHAGGKLAAAVCRAGGLGFIGCGHWLAAEAGLAQLREQVEIFRRDEEQQRDATYPLCLGFIGHSTFQEDAGWERFESVLQAYKPAVVQFFAPAVVRHDKYVSNVVMAQLHHAKVLAQVGTVKEAVEAVDAGADGLIVQGSEAGGHGIRRELASGTLPLAATVVARLSARPGSEHVPVIAAGGIVNGRTMAAALALGCDGVVLGTRLWASQESIGWQAYKDRLAAAESCDDVVRTTTFDSIQNTYSATPWPEPFDSVGALRNVTSATWDGRSHELAAALLQQQPDGSSTLVDDYRRACEQGNADIALVHAGEGVGLIDAIEPAYDIVTRISDDAANVIRNLPMQLLQS